VVDTKKQCQQTINKMKKQGASKKEIQIFLKSCQQKIDALQSQSKLMQKGTSVLQQGLVMSPPNLTKTQDSQQMEGFAAIGIAAATIGIVIGVSMVSLKRGK